MRINRGNYSIVQLKVDNQSESVNKAIKDLVIPVDAVLIAISRGKDVIIPCGDAVIHGGNKILALADEDAQVTINGLFGPRV